MTRTCKHCHKPFKLEAHMPRTQVTCSEECGRLRHLTMGRRNKKRHALRLRVSRRLSAQ